MPEDRYLSGRIRKRGQIHMKHIITEQLINEFKKYLEYEEKSAATIEKYIRDIKKLMDFAGGREITKNLMIEYKENLRIERNYKLSSINSFLIATNRLFGYLEWYGLSTRTYRIQKEAFVSRKRNLSMYEYKKLVMAVRSKGNRRLEMIIQTLCSMGIRISELSYITVESVKTGEVDIYGKRKQRKALIPAKLQKQLEQYISDNKIKSGIVFRTSSGNAVDRSNVWREMKALKEETHVEEEKIFPHNLRHLFAKTFYKTEKDIAKLADILGHNSIETTRIYIRTTCEEYKKQLDKMELVI